jgi:hypothetical protein
MRIDKAPPERRENQPLANAPGASAGNFRASGTSFASALQQHRHKAAAPNRESRTSADGEARRSVSRAGAEAAGECSLADEELLPTDGLAMPSQMLALLSTNGETSAPAAATMGAALAARRRSVAGAADASPCIEVTHPGTGGRFVLSRKDGVWLLSLQDQPAMSAAELERFVQDLREHFAERGLGEVDVIV